MLIAYNYRILNNLFRLFDSITIRFSYGFEWINLLLIVIPIIIVNKIVLFQQSCQCAID